MRELKFRVYIPDRKVLEYFELGKFYLSDNYLLQHKYHVQQYTGLKDSKGVPIYEGDIVEFDDSLISEKPTVGAAEIIWCDDLTLVDAPQWGLWFVSPKSGFCKSMMGLITIIGNINENPELINQNS